MRTPPAPLPLPVRESVAALGAGLRRLRLRGMLPMTYAAERIAISRSTLYKIERGDPAVSIGTYARVLAGFGVLERLEHLADPRRTRSELDRELGRLPRRVHQPPDRSMRQV